MFVDRLDDRTQKQQELCVFIRRVARFQQIDPGIGRDRPVVVLAAAVDARKRLLMQQRDQIVLLRNALDQLHRQLVVVGGDVGRREDRCDLILRRCHLIVFGLGRNAQFPQLGIQLIHECLHTGFDRSEVMVLHLLSLRRRRAKQRTSGIDQILALAVIRLVDQKVFLFAAHRRLDASDILVAKQLQDAHRLSVDRLHAAQQRCLLIQGMSAVRTERGRYA